MASAAKSALPTERTIPGLRESVLDRTDITDVLQRHSIDLRRTGVAELHGPCIACGGTDRLTVRTDRSAGHPHPRAFCRQCSQVWDAIQAEQHLGGGSYNEALRRLAQLLGLGTTPVPSPPQKKQGGKGRGSGAPPSACNPAHAVPGCTLAAYAEAKGLPPAFLAEIGVREIRYLGHPAVRIPYRAEDGTETAVRFRTGLTRTEGADDRFRWRKGSKPGLYGRERLHQAREHGEIWLVEGESDCHTAWFAGIDAIGVPGASTWNDGRDAPALDGIGIIWAVVEPDDGGESLLRRLRPSTIRDRVQVVRLADGCKDLSDLFQRVGRNPEHLRAALDDAKTAARPLGDLADEETAAAHEAAWTRCQALATQSDILAAVVEMVALLGAVGEARLVKLLYLALVSRLLGQPVSLAVKGHSSTGKSFTVTTVLRLFPAHAYHALTAMSERALVYSDEPLAHRMLVIYEAAGIGGDIATYLIRSILSEGRLVYTTVESTPAGIKPVTIEREGPTGLITTTTALRLHSENETRMLSVPVSDTPEQTKAILRRLAQDTTEDPDLDEFLALQDWLLGASTEVEIPFAEVLADLVPPMAVRLRRDFGQVLSLIRAHTVLHQASRDRNAQGRIVATLADYAAVHTLVDDLLAEGIGTSIPFTVRETVQAVRDLTDGAFAPDVTIAMVAVRLGIDPSTASRRVAAAVGLGYLVNDETRSRQRARIRLGDPMPDDCAVLPAPEVLRGHVCGEITVGPPPPPKDGPAINLKLDLGSRGNGAESPAVLTCLECGDPLDAGRKYHCAACQEAGERAGT